MNKSYFVFRRISHIFTHSVEDFFNIFPMKRLSIIFFLFAIIFAVYGQPDAVVLSHYLFPEFQEGKVLMKDGTEVKTRLNYNALTEEVIFDDHGNILAIGKNVIPQIDTVFIGDKKYLYKDGKFLEVLHDSSYKFFVQHKCRVIPPGKPAAYCGTSEISAIDSYSSLISDGRVYDLKLPDDFKVKPYMVYWIEKEGKFKSFLSLGQLKSFYKKKKKLYEEYVKNHKVEFEDPKSIADLVNYMETH
jgi:hypothetical protein